MKIKRLLAVGTALVCALAITACSQKAEPEKKDDAQSAPQITVNKDKKEVIVPAEVNGKYFTEGTRHGVVFKDGSNGEKAVLRGLASEKDFHAALLEIGAKPGDNLTMADMKKKASENITVQGAKINAFVKVEGSDKEIPFNDVIKATKGELKPMDLRFGGNIENAKKANTGCILCLDSCAVGITSNASYPVGTTQEKVTEFNGNKDVLPADGTKVSVIFRLAE